jgi:hypothetical protein
MTLAEVEEKAGFTVQSPALLPETLIFKGASYDSTTHIVSLTYHYNDPNFPENTNGLVLRETIMPASGLCDLCGFVVGQYNGDPKTAGRGVVGDNAIIQTVPIGTLEGQYVEGVWNGTNRGWVYDTTSYVKTLRWQANGMAFELVYFGEEIQQADLIAIAERTK